MRFWKAGAAAALAIGGALVFYAADAHGQVRRERDIRQPLDAARQVLTLMSGSRIGIGIDDVTAADVTGKKLPSESGVIVREVEDESPASRAGLKAGDVIVEFDGERVRSAAQLRRLIQETPEGRKTGVIVTRDGQRVTLTVTPEGHSAESVVMPRLEMMPRPPRAPRAPVAPMPPHMLPEGFTFTLRGGRLGVSTQTLTEQLATHFGVEGGVLVTDVSEDSAASKAGLRAGDVITKVGSTAIDDTADLARAIGEASGEVAIAIVRDRKAQTLKATLEPARARTARRIF